jgi:hypothetical protein
MSDPRLTALVAEWRRTADLDEGVADDYARQDRPIPESRFFAYAMARRACADALEAALAEPEPVMHRVPYGDGKTALVSGPVGERMAAAAAADGGSDDES